MICSNGNVSVGGVSISLSPRSAGRVRGCAVMEQLCGPGDILFKKKRLRLYLPRREKKAILSKKMDAGRVSILSEKIGSAVVRESPVNSFRVISARPAIITSLSVSHKFMAALLFAPFLGLAGKSIIERVGLGYHTADGVTVSPMDPSLANNYFESLSFIFLRWLWVILPLIALFRLIRVSLRNGFIHYYSSNGVVSIARGAVIRSILHFPPDAADASIIIESPFLRLLKKSAAFLCVSGAGMTAIPVEALNGCDGKREIMRLERRLSEGGSWSGYIFAAAAVCITAVHYSIKYLSYWKMITAAFIPAALLLLYRALAEAMLGKRPAVKLYRDEVVVSGVWGFSAVNITIGRDNIANAFISQSIIQKGRDLCDLTIKAAGTARRVRCRNVDYPRAKALLTRLCRAS